MILDKVWGMRIQPDTNVVDVHIYRLRGKVDGAGQQPLIRTMRGWAMSSKTDRAADAQRRMAHLALGNARLRLRHHGGLCISPKLCGR